MEKISEEEIRKLAAYASRPNTPVNEDVRKQIPKGESADFYQGLITGIFLSQEIMKGFGRTLKPDSEAGAVAKEVQLFTALSSPVMVAAAESYMKAKNLKDK